MTFQTANQIRKERLDHMALRHWLAAMRQGKAPNDIRRAALNFQKSFKERDGE